MLWLRTPRHRQVRGDGDLGHSRMLLQQWVACDLVARLRICAVPHDRCSEIRIEGRACHRLRVQPSNTLVKR